jgi:hypothetical protein
MLAPFSASTRPEGILLRWVSLVPSQDQPGGRWIYRCAGRLVYHVQGMDARAERSEQRTTVPL